MSVLRPPNMRKITNNRKTLQMIDRDWYISQIKKKWLKYLSISNQHRPDNCDDWFEIGQNAHREYYVFMYRAKKILGFSNVDVWRWLREAEAENE